MTTFSVGLSTCMNSSNRILTLRVFTLVALSPGVEPTMAGGVSSNHPPSGWPILAHDIISMMSSRQVYGVNVFVMTGCFVGCLQT